MEPRIDLNGGPHASAAPEALVTVGEEAETAHLAPVFIAQPEAQTPSAPESRRRGLAGKLWRSVVVAWIVAAVLFAAVGALAVMERGERGRLAAQQARATSLQARMTSLTAAKAGLQGQIADLKERGEDMSGELGKCVQAVKSMERLTTAMADALTAPTQRAFDRAIQRVDRLAEPAWDARTVCLAQSDAGPTSL